MSFGHALTVPVRVRRIRPHLFQNHTIQPHVTHALGSTRSNLSISSSACSFIGLPGDLDPLCQPSDITLAIRKMLAPPRPASDTGSSSAQASLSKYVLSSSTHSPAQPLVATSFKSRSFKTHVPFSASSPDLTVYTINDLTPLPLRRAQTTVPHAHRFPTTNLASSLYRMAMANVAKRRPTHAKSHSAAAVDASRENRDNATLHDRQAPVQPAIYKAGDPVFRESRANDFEHSGTMDRVSPEYDPPPRDASGGSKSRQRESRFLETGFSQHMLSSASLYEPRCGPDTQPKPPTLKSFLSFLNPLATVSPKRSWLQKLPPRTTLKALVDRMSPPSGSKVSVCDGGVEQSKSTSQSRYPSTLKRMEAIL
ncbi:hypothetical protein DENSPDRAFT_840421 [Dentipellis sp. KUC8613]|nr:hypothetical protein DENSPDRAFT_840421 [Dentipellis sp. KUC8613]